MNTDQLHKRIVMAVEFARQMRVRHQLSLSNGNIHNVTVLALTIKEVNLFNAELIRLNLLISEFIKETPTLAPEDIDVLWLRYTFAIAIFHVTCTEVLKTNHLKVQDSRIALTSHCLEQLPVDSEIYRIICFYIGSYYADFATKLNNVRCADAFTCAVAALNYLNIALIPPEKLNQSPQPTILTYENLDHAFVNRFKFHEAWQAGAAMLHLIKAHLNVEDLTEDRLREVLTDEQAKKPPRKQQPLKVKETLTYQQRGFVKSAINCVCDFLDEKVESLIKEYQAVNFHPFSNSRQQPKNSTPRLFGEKTDAVPGIIEIQQAVEAVKKMLLDSDIPRDMEEHLDILNRSCLKECIDDFLKKAFPPSLRFKSNTRLGSIDDILALVKVSTVSPKPR